MQREAVGSTQLVSDFFYRFADSSGPFYFDHTFWGVDRIACDLGNQTSQVLDQYGQMKVLGRQIGTF